MYLYQKTNRYFAQVADDIKEMASEELVSLGASDVKPIYRGIYFTADAKTLYQINYCSRLLSRVLAPLISFKCHSDKILYKEARQISWEDFLQSNQTFAIFSSVSNSAITHSKYAALRLKDAIVDHFRDRTGKRPSVDTTDPDVWFNLHIENNQATIGLDTSGGSLHKRGYRRKSISAPMIETVAAAILNYSEWDGSTQLVDPFCGSGTILCEAFMAAANLPANFYRKKFGFEKLPDFKSGLWNEARQEGRAGIKHLPPGLIIGSDTSAQAVKAAIENCSFLDKNYVIDIRQQNVFDIQEIEGKTIICNPPYGIRMGAGVNLEHFYKNFGDFLKQRCCGSTAYIYFGERNYIKNIGLKPSWKKLLSTGGLDGRLVKYELY